MVDTTAHKNVKSLRRIARAHYNKHGRHDLPWRNTRNPYRVLVSEIMLQQTQVARVLPKYKTFLKQFPSIQTLAEAPLRDVLMAWQGLGYNRRAKMLHETAQQVVGQHHGRMPRTYEALLTLPGVGPYTAGAVCVFAYSQAIPLVETNIRTVLFHHQLTQGSDVTDKQLLRIMALLQDAEKPREWYWALMDYGAHLKQKGIKTNALSRHYTKQSKFKGSDREVRGAIIRLLASESKLTAAVIAQKVKAAPDRVRAQLANLKREGLVQCRAQRWLL